jgi:hypothetical protein
MCSSPQLFILLTFDICILCLIATYPFVRTACSQKFSLLFLAQLKMVGSPEIGNTPPQVDLPAAGKTEDADNVQIEQMESRGIEGKNDPDFDRVDGEVAKYAGDAKIVIDEETNSRLRRLIDRRVLAIMIFTYFLQALDKGTLSFASIMGIQKDASLHGQQV